MLELFLSSPEKTVDLVCNELSLTTVNGDITILAGHAPLLTLLPIDASISVKSHVKENCKTYQLKSIATLQVENNKCTITAIVFTDLTT